MTAAGFSFLEMESEVSLSLPGITSANSLCWAQRYSRQKCSLQARGRDKTGRGSLDRAS